jgi:serine protease Do
MIYSCVEDIMLNFKAFSLAAIFVVIGLVVGLTLSSNLDIQSNGYTKEKEKEISRSTVDVLSKVSEALVEVVAAVRPSVVNISTTRIIQRRGSTSPFFNDPFFRRFFGDEMFREFEKPREEKRSSLGSGTIVREDGYILTNNHVIKEAETIKVTLSDKREFEGKVIGTDPKSDLAVIKIDAKDLPALKWGDSDKLRVGEMVIAVGSPYGLSQTVTSGIVSAKGRANVRIADYEDFIQTDAAINPGNSGGPLLNVRGELVGINTAIFSTSGGYQGIGFAIPSNMADVVLQSLIKEGKVIRGWLGVSIQTVTKELAEQFGIEEGRGALVSDVVEDSPAEKAGLKRADVIVKYNGRNVEDSLGLRNMVAATLPGNEVKITVVRDGKELVLPVTIAELTDELRGLEGSYENVLRDIHIQDLTPELRQSLGVSKRVKGVVITDAPESTRLKRGDVILEVNRKPVEIVEEYDKVASKIKEGQDVLLLVYRDGGVFYMTLTEE